MESNVKNIRYDDELKIEAYQFIEVTQKFPNHFHEYYVVGLIESGQRCLTVNNRVYTIDSGDMMTFNPMDSHACEQTGGKGLNYRCLNIKQEIMDQVTYEVFGSNRKIRFQEPVQYRTELKSIFSELHEIIMEGIEGLEKEELFLLFMQQLLTSYAESDALQPIQEPRKEVEDVCAYLEKHYTERVTLDMLAGIAGLNKYTLVRTFTRVKGITPYRYFETIRIGHAKRLLEQGVEPIDAAQRTGFYDQSHFTDFFNKLIGLTPKQYQSIFNEKMESHQS